MGFSMFKAVAAFRLIPGAVNFDTLDEVLGKRIFQSCGAESPESLGWTEVVADSGLGGCRMDGQVVLALRIETKKVPGSAVRAAVKERCAEIEKAEGRRVGRKEQREINEAVTAGLLTRAIPSTKDVHVWIDTRDNWIGVDSSSVGTVDMVLEMLSKTFEQPVAKPVKTVLSPSAAMTAWLAADEPPASFTIDMDCSLKGAEGQTVRFAKHSLEGQIAQHLEQGKVPVALGLTYADRVSFVLGEDGRLKKLAFVDAVVDEHRESDASRESDACERAQADLVFMGGELRGLLGAVVGVLGGEEAKGEDDAA